VTAAKAAARRARREELGLWVSAFTPVVAWIGAQQVGFILSPWICATGHRWVLVAVTGLALLAASAGARASWRRWKRLPDEDAGESRGLARRRFMTAGSLLLAAIFLLAIAALAVPALVHRPCD